MNFENFDYHVCVRIYVVYVAVFHCSLSFGKRNSVGLFSPEFYAEAKQEFDGSCSVQVYSVQACIPKDPAVLWNVEFVQAEELFKQPSTIDNCLRDNRYICCLLI